jgi:hypothetical protein
LPVKKSVKLPREVELDRELLPDVEFERDVEPYVGRPLLVRLVACGARESPRLKARPIAEKRSTREVPLDSWARTARSPHVESVIAKTAIPATNSFRPLDMVLSLRNEIPDQT